MTPALDPQQVFLSNANAAPVANAANANAANANAANSEPTGSPQGAHRKPTGSPQGAHREPTGAHAGAHGREACDNLLPLDIREDPYRPSLFGEKVLKNDFWGEGGLWCRFLLLLFFY